uniref:Protein FAM136A n=1 Tax=Callorhinchus milii TaxID=7868 RepID=V9LHH5_CALMI|eukprot:gi/632991601/ref/XP_007884702.1/ PREDICTED: protein FAM136A-like [Callorhinchus milii]
MDGAEAEAEQLRLQEAVDEMVQGLEKEQIRKMQAKMFRCSADCCENATASMHQVHQCIERCHTSLAQAQTTVTGELERFQNRLQRCIMECNDKARDGLDSGLKPDAVKREAEGCVRRCVSDHSLLVPSIARTLKHNLASLEK